MSSRNESRWAFWTVCTFIAIFLGFSQGWSKLNFALLACFLFTGGLRLLIIKFESQTLRRVRAMEPDERAEYLNCMNDRQREDMKKKLEAQDA